MRWNRPVFGGLFLGASFAVAPCWAQEPEPCPPGRVCTELPPREAADRGPEDAGRREAEEELVEPSEQSSTAPAALQPLPASRAFSEPPPPPPPAPRRGSDRTKRRMAVAPRLQAPFLGSNAAQSAAMGGIGLAFRYRPLGALALDAGFDLFGGKDWEGNPRRELALSGEVELFVNPRSALQFYLLGGLALSRASVELERDEVLADGDSTPKYSYLGGQLGAGVEWRIRPMLALNAGMVAFMRGRTDPRAAQEPEFVHEDTGVATNTSSGVLLRVSVPIYF